MQTPVLQQVRSLEHDGGKMSSSAYDTASHTRVTDQRGKSLFPECVRWLLENQHPDGSWGSQILDYHDRVLSTLSAIMALNEIDRRQYEPYIQRGETYIWEHMKYLEVETCQFVGGEMLLPSLIQQAQSMGLDLPLHMKVYEKAHHAKLKKIEESMWYSPLTSLSFSLEFLGNNVDLACLPNILLSNGSVGNSPAATAFFLTHRKNAKALRYLKTVLQLTGDGSMMEAYPIDVFELGWIMYNLISAGLYLEWYAEICDLLLSCMGRLGVGMSSGFPVPDLDDTIMGCRALYEMHYPVDFSIIDAYDVGDYFATYPFEVGASVSTNIHVLDFVKNCSEFPNREEVIERLVRFIRREIHPGGYWTDKWHVSPYYTTGHAVLALCNVDLALVETAISWILESQNENGTWGEKGGTLEETALAVQALMYYHRHIERIDTEIVSNAISVLDYGGSTLASAKLPDMWICKVLYNPVRIVWSAITSARFMAKTRHL